MVYDTKFRSRFTICIRLIRDGMPMIFCNKLESVTHGIQESG